MNLEILIIIAGVFGIVGFILRLKGTGEKLLDVMEHRFPAGNEAPNDKICDFLGILNRYRGKIGFVLILIASVIGIIISLISLSADV